MIFNLKHTLILISLSIFFFYGFHLENIKLGLDLRGGSSLLFKTEDFQMKFKNDMKNDILTILMKNNIEKKELSFISEQNNIVLVIEGENEGESDQIGLLLNEYNIKSKKVNNDLRIAYSEQMVYQKQKEEFSSLISKIKNRLDQYGLSEPYVIKQGQDKIYIELPGISNIENLDNTIKLIKTPTKITFNPVLKMKNNKFENSLSDPKNELHYELDIPLFTGKEIVSSKTIFENGKPAVSFSLNSIAGKAFSDFTGQNVGRQLAIVLDGKVLSAPRIGGRINGGQAQITGDYTLEETKILSIALKSGALPLKMDLQETKIIGPSLGEKNIEYGIFSILFGISLVSLFLLLFYRKNGLIILSSLFFNIVLVLFIITKFGFVLTLPGIAGLILTIGMAIDANIIIQERIKQLKRKKNVNEILRGYQEAKVAIFDANITTILVGIVLYSYGTGPLKSFALVLIIGISTSIYTSVFYTEEIYKNIVSKGKQDD